MAVVNEAENGVAALAERLVTLFESRSRPTMVIGLTGSVAVGKTTLANKLVDALSEQLRVETVSIDGFLFPNEVLAERDILMRKGRPETYDHDAIAEALTNLRRGSAEFPGYSHVTYDIDPAMMRAIEQPDILILEGLGFHPPTDPPRVSGEPDLLIYLDASLDDLETWFVDRFLRFWIAAENDPTSFYAKFRHMSEPELIEFSRAVWSNMNLPNLKEDILPLRVVADMVVKKDASHSIEIIIDKVSW